MTPGDFRTDEAIQQAAIESAIDECDTSDREQREKLARDAARCAYERFFRCRVGYFAGESGCIVYANMGRDNQSARDRFRRRLEQAGVAELAAAVWPLGDATNAHYTWAVFLDDADAERWEEEARSAWVEETRS